MGLAVFLLPLIWLFAVEQAPHFDLSVSLLTFLRHCRNSAPHCPNFGLWRSFSACSAQFVEDSVLSDTGEVSAVTVLLADVAFCVDSTVSSTVETAVSGDPSTDDSATPLA